MIEFIVGFFLGTVITLLICSIISRYEKNHPESSTIIHEAINDIKFTLDRIIKKIESMQPVQNK